MINRESTCPQSIQSRPSKGVFRTLACIVLLTLLAAVSALKPAGGAVVVPAGEAQPPGEVAHHAAAAFEDPYEAVLNAFGLHEARLEFLDVRGGPDEPLTVILPIDEVGAVLELHPHSVRRPGYRLFAQTAAGVMEELEPGPIRTLRGELASVPFSRAAGALLHDGLHARIDLPDGRQYWVEPAVALLRDAPEDLYIIYRAEDVIRHDHFRCGVDESYRIAPPFGAEGDFIAPHGLRGGETLCIAELGADADFEYFNRWGGEVELIEARIESVINTLNMQYEDEVGIRHEITTIIVRTTEENPYTSTNASTLLTQFRDEWNNNQGQIVRDVAQLFSGKNFDGSTVGLAWVGAVCTDHGYSIVQSLNNFACATDVSSHELGHNWNASHCTCPDYTMNPSLACANQFHPDLTIPTIIAFRDTRACLTCESGGIAEFQSFTVIRGSWRRGDLESLLFSDDDHVRIDSQTIANNNTSHERIVLRIDAVSPTTLPSEIIVTLETGCTANDVRTAVHLWNYNTGSWRRVDIFDQSRPDSIRIRTVDHRPERFVHPDTGAMRLRIRMNRRGDVEFLGRFDWAELFIRP